MDFTGTFLGLLTLPMVLLNLAAFVSGIVLVGRGDGRQIMVGAVVFVIGMLVATMIKGGTGRLALFARNAMIDNRKMLAIAAAILDSLLPIIIIMSCEIAALTSLQDQIVLHDDVALWLWSYGVVTGIWTFRAWRARPQDQTLSRIQAYSAQLAYATLSLAVLVLHWSLVEALVVMAIPMLLPLIVGFFIAIADRDALRDVQI